MKILSFLIGVLVMGGALARAQSVGPVQTAVRLSPVAAGEMAPDFTLEDFVVKNNKRRKITLSAARDSTPVVVVFYRGHW